MIYKMLVLISHKTLAFSAGCCILASPVPKSSIFGTVTLCATRAFLKPFGYQAHLVKTCTILFRTVMVQLKALLVCGSATQVFNPTGLNIIFHLNAKLYLFLKDVFNY